MIVLIVVSDGIDNGTQADDNLTMLLFQLKRFNIIFFPIGCTGCVITNVDDPAFTDVMMNWNLVLDVQFGIDPV